MNIDIKRVCIHECSHAIVARLFAPRISIEKIVVNAEFVKQGQDQGALHVKGPLFNDEQDYTALAITLFAGLVGENMYLLGKDIIKEREEEIMKDNTVLDWLFAGGDTIAFRNNAVVFHLIHQIDEYRLKEFSLRFLINFLNHNEIWVMVEKLCDELQKKDDLTLNEEELESVFTKIGLDQLLNEKRQEYLKPCDNVLQFCQRTNPLY